MRIDDLKRVVSEIRPSTDEYALCSEFIEYLYDTKEMNIHVDGYNPQLENISHDFGYPHRYSPGYVKGRFSKMYELEEWLKSNNRPVTFLTLTVRQKKDKYGNVLTDIENIKENFDKLKLGWKRIRALIADMGYKIDYVGTCEPHESGNPHYHIIIFHEFTDDEKNKLKNSWEKWGIGSFEHGLDFDIRPKNDIKSIRNYLLSYMLKSLPEYDSKYKKTETWTAEELLFNSVAWYFHYRTWFASNNLSKVMSYKSTDNGNSNIWTSSILQRGFDEYELWRDDSLILGAKLKLIDEIKDLYNEEEYKMKRKEIEKLKNECIEYEKPLVSREKGDYRVIHRPKRNTIDFESGNQGRLVIE